MAQVEAEARRADEPRGFASARRTAMAAGRHGLIAKIKKGLAVEVPDPCFAPNPRRLNLLSDEIVIIVQGYWGKCIECLRLLGGRTIMWAPFGAKNAAALLPLTIAAALNTGCETSFFTTHHPKSLADAGSYHIAVIAAIPFEAIRDKLRPTFTLTADTARQQVIPTTTYFEDRVLQTFGAAVGVGLPTRSTSGTRTVTEENGTITTKGTQTTTTAPGTAPTPKGTGQTTLTPEGKAAATLTTAAEEKRAVKRDPIVEHNLATALFQEVRLLEAYLDYIEQRAGYTPYILRVNVSLQPYARNQPYDAYVSIGFFNARNEVPDDLPLAIPLLVTDNLEGTSTAKTAEVLTQLAIAITAVSKGVGVSGDLGFSRDHLKSILGTDLNSVLTVSRAVDNVIKVRLGAPRQPTAGFAMVPRNHTISVLVLPKKDIRGLSVVTRTTLRDADSGAVLPYDREDVFASAKATLRRFYARFPGPLAKLSTEESIAALIGAIQGRREEEFKAIVRQAFASDPATPDPEARLRTWENLWTALSETSSATEFQATAVSLPDPGKKPGARGRR